MERQGWNGKDPSSGMSSLIFIQITCQLGKGDAIPGAIWGRAKFYNCANLFLASHCYQLWLFEVRKSWVLPPSSRSLSVANDSFPEEIENNRMWFSINMICQKLPPQMSLLRWDNLHCTRSIALFSNRVERNSDAWTNLSHCHSWSAALL